MLHTANKGRKPSAEAGKSAEPIGGFDRVA